MACSSLKQPYLFAAHFPYGKEKKHLAKLYAIYVVNSDSQ